MSGDGMSALEFKQMAAEDRDWRIFDQLQRGAVKMERLREDMDELKVCFDGHCADPAAHHEPQAEKIPGKVKEYKWQIIAVVVTTVSAIILAALGLSGG